MNQTSVFSGSTPRSTKGVGSFRGGVMVSDYLEDSRYSARVIMHMWGGGTLNGPPLPAQTRLLKPRNQVRQQVTEAAKHAGGPESSCQGEKSKSRGGQMLCSVALNNSRRALILSLSGVPHCARSVRVPSQMNGLSCQMQFGFGPPGNNRDMCVAIVVARTHGSST
jgi:hypothetical protein